MLFANLLLRGMPLHTSTASNAFAKDRLHLWGSLRQVSKSPAADLPGVVKHNAEWHLLCTCCAVLDPGVTWQCKQVCCEAEHVAICHLKVSTGQEACNKAVPSCNAGRLNRCKSIHIVNVISPPYMYLDIGYMCTTLLDQDLSYRSYYPCLLFKADKPTSSDDEL